MIRLSFVAILAAGFASAAPAGSPDPKTLEIPPGELSRARELVQQLGSDQYSIREKAEQELARMGRLARPALLEAANTDPNQEIRARCSNLLPRATALDLKARLDVFLADTEGKYEHDLPGWAEFRATVRSEWTLLGHELSSNRSLDGPAREVYAEIMAEPVNRQIIMATCGSRKELGSIASSRRQELYAQKFPRNVVRGGRVIVTSSTLRHDPTVEDLATLLFAETLAPPRFTPRGVSISRLITASGFAKEARDDTERGKVYRALAAAWVDTRIDPLDMYQSMSIATSLGLTEEGNRLAIRLLMSPGAVGSYRGMAATNLARFGNKEHIPLLERALADAAVVISIRENVVGRPANELPTHDVQVRDLALAVGVILSGQKLEDYSFVDNFRTSGGISNSSYSYNRYYLPTNKRDEMLRKWKDWRDKNP
jgi:hypothetical protein